MIPPDYELSFQSPTVPEYLAMRCKVDLGEVDPALAQQALEASLFHVTIRDQGKLIAMARVVGDGALYFYIQDVAVGPDYQNQGLGDALMLKLEAFLSGVTQKGATIGLLAAKNKESFYARYGYLDRSGEPLGRGMSKFV
jgi:ribosomal protein S18 acetylase RimI-like enzyme